MTTYAVLALFLIASGAMVMLLSIRRFSKTIEQANELLPIEEKTIRKLGKLLRILMYFFFCGYLAVFFSIVLNQQLLGSLFIGIIFFGGAVFVFLGNILQAKMLASVGERCGQIAQQNDRLLQTENVTIYALAYQAEVRDRETGKHLERCCEFVRVLAEELSHLPKYQSYLTENYIADIARAAALHDIGKVGVPDSILKKNGKLTPEEFEHIKKHCEYGADILGAAEQKLTFESFLSIAVKIIMAHHERWDGKGYPHGLKGEEIPLSARIMALVDVYDALISKRCYKDAYSHQETSSIIVSEREKHFDPEIVDAFLRVEHRFVEISTSLSD